MSCGCSVCASAGCKCSRRVVVGTTCLQAVPGFDAKGIETVRRDTCPAVAKTMERSLRLLFATRDLSEVLSHAHTPSTCYPPVLHVAGWNKLGMRHI